MRIITGSQKGRVLVSPKGSWMRPTSDRAKEYIFDCLGPRIEGARVLDLFAGTGNLGIEALSRGAERVTFVDKAKPAIELIRKTLVLTSFVSKAKVVRADVFRFLNSCSSRGEKYDIILADPPYKGDTEDSLLLQIDKCGILEKGGLVILEHNSRKKLYPKYQWLILSSLKSLGETAISFYRNQGR